MVLVEEVWDRLRQVNDPELPIISIVDLGIVRDVAINNRQLLVTITPTYSGCPAMAAIEADIKHCLQDFGLQGFAPVVRTELAPAWTSDWISAEGRRKLEQYGIAPPHYPADACVAAGNIAIMPLHAQVRCPNCRSLQTELVSEFGSTACKALYRCRSCLEPFDYFKPL